MKKYSFITAVFSILLLSASVFAQIGIPGASPVTENFDSIGTSATAALPANWKMSSAGTGASSNWTTGTNVTATTQAASSGSPTAGGRYNWGTTAGTDRAIGFMTSGSYASPNTIMSYYRNTSGSTISNLDINFQFERYRINTANAAVLFFTSTDGINWTSRTAGDIPASAFPTGASSYTFGAPTTVTRSVTLTGINIPNNGDFYLRWIVDTTGTNSQGLGLDEVSLTPTLSTPTPTLTINDVSQSEGDAGTTNFTFTVSLSSSTHGGVTFDIATADGTATTANNDYVLNSLTAQTIPNGSSSYQFTVAVNGDTAVEPNETFFVNVTNVTGATVTDGQGQGTINNDDATSVQFAQPAYTVNEGAGTVTLTVTRTGSSTGAISVNYAFAGITANGAATCTAGIDFAAVSGTLNWADGDNTPKTFNVTICDDALIESSESFISQLQNPTGGATIGAQSSTQVDITDDDSDTVAPVITYTPISNNPATTSLTATVTDAVGVTGVSIFWSINGGSFTSAPCSSASGTPQDGTWTCIITGAPNPSSVAYYVTATDGTNTATNPSGGAGAPNLFTIGSATIPAGTYTDLSLGNGVSLGGDVVVNGSLTLSGVVNAGANKLTLGCGVQVTGGGEGSYVVGRFERLFCGTETFTFNVGAPFALPPFAPESESLAPEGVVSNYSPVTVQITGGTPGSSLTVSVTDQFLPGSRTDNSASRFWTLTETGDLTANLSFTYRNEDVNGDESIYNVLRRSGGVTTRFDSTINPATNTASVNGISNFSDWAVGNLIPTAAGAEIGGQLVTASGEGIRNATVMITGGNLTAPLYVQTGTFGNYKFSNLPVGQTYVVTVMSKRFTFANPSRIVNLLENVTDENFVADEQ